MHTQTFELTEATIPRLRWVLSTGIVTSHDLVAQYLARIDAYDRHGPALNAISVTNGKALAEADARDAERRSGATIVPGRNSMAGRVALEGRVVHIEDIRADPDFAVPETVTIA